MKKLLRVSFFLSIFWLLVSCASFDPDYGEKDDSVGPQMAVYYSEYDRVWRAAQLALAHYPLRINNMDIGVLETEYIRGLRAWTSPAESKGPSDGERYQLVVRVIRGKSKSLSAIKVIVSKRILYMKNFFAEGREKSSDGLEESVILYRIKRELVIETALEKALSQKDDEVSENEEPEEFELAEEDVEESEEAPEPIIVEEEPPPQQIEREYSGKKVAKAKIKKKKRRRDKKRRRPPPKRKRSYADEDADEIDYSEFGL